MAVQVERHGRALVAEHLLNDLHIRAGRDGQARGCVARAGESRETRSGCGSWGRGRPELPASRQPNRRPWDSPAADRRALSTLRFSTDCSRLVTTTYPPSTQIRGLLPTLQSLAGLGLAQGFLERLFLLDGQLFASLDVIRVRDRSMIV